MRYIVAHESLSGGVYKTQLLDQHDKYKVKGKRLVDMGMQRECVVVTDNVTNNLQYLQCYPRHEEYQGSDQVFHT